MSVSVNGPKTPVTKGSNGIATATLPNICKMPGPPAPFVPAPLPNIGKSGDSPKGYSKKVKIEGNTVAIKGASFKSMGDMASKGTGGGMLSANTHGPCKFISPGSMDVKFEGKNVHLLTDMMTNNGGPSGSPPNAATMLGIVFTSGDVVSVPKGDKCPICNDKHGDFGETEETKVSASELIKAYGDKKKHPRASRKRKMIGVAICGSCNQKYAGATTADREFYATARDEHFHVVSKTAYQETTVNKMKEHFGENSAFGHALLSADFQNEFFRGLRGLLKEKGKTDEVFYSVNPPGACAAQKALVTLLDHNCNPSGLTEKWYSPDPDKEEKKGDSKDYITILRQGKLTAVEKKGKTTAPILHKNAQGELTETEFMHEESVPPCLTCNLLLPFLTCSKKKEDDCPKPEKDVTDCFTCEGKKK